MTVITAMECGDYLLMAGDSQASTENLKVPVIKLDSVQDPPLAWGFAGDESIGLDFGFWLKGRKWRETDDWETVRQEAATTLARLNGRRRDLAELARTPITEDQLTDVLIAGFVGARPGILQLESSGGSFLRRMQPLVAIGDGSTHALLVRGTLESVGLLKRYNNIRLIHLVTGLAAHFAPRSNPPVRVLRITRDGVEDVNHEQTEGDRT